MAGRSGDTAWLLILIGLVLQIISVLILFGVSALFSSIPIVGGIVLLLAFLGLIFVILVYFFSYRRAADGDYEGARTPTLVFGILSLISLGLVSGILYIIAYVKLGDAADEEERAGRSGWITYGGVPVQSNPPTGALGPNTGFGYTSPPLSSPSSPTNPVFCTNCGQPTFPQARYCRNCGTRLQ